MAGLWAMTLFRVPLESQDAGIAHATSLKAWILICHINQALKWRASNEHFSIRKRLSYETVKPGGLVGKDHSFGKARLYYDCYDPWGPRRTSTRKFNPIWGKLCFCHNSCANMVSHGGPNSKIDDTLWLARWLDYGLWRFLGYLWKAKKQALHIL